MLEGRGDNNSGNNNHNNIFVEVRQSVHNTRACSELVFRIGALRPRAVVHLLVTAISALSVAAASGTV
jgi:hypothetical protein